MNEKFYSSYLQLLNKNKIPLVLVPEEFLLDLTKIITNFLGYLWEKPDFLAKILIYNDLNDANNTLFSLIVNRFYQNILSSSFIEENLLYVIVIIFKNEIYKNEFDNLKFLENSKTSLLMDELRNNLEIKKYSKNVILEIIKKLEYDYGKELFKIELDNYVNEKFEEKIDINKIENQKLKDLDDEKNQYLTDLSKFELEKYINDDKGQKEKYFLSELTQKIERYKNLNLFSNSIFVKTIPKEINSCSYKNGYLSIIGLLDLFFNQIENTTIPIELKYICKITYILIKNKFPQVKEYEIFSFIGKNIISKLLIPLFKDPLEIYITEFLISENTLSNLNLFLLILSKLTSFELYLNKDKELIYIPFNTYFIEKMPYLFNFYKKIIKIELPIFIELFVNDELNNDFLYNYFNENRNEIMINKSIAFTLEDINYLIKIIDKNKDQLFNKKTDIDDSKENKIEDIFNKLNTDNNKKFLLNLEKMNISNKKDNYILLQKLLINPKYDYLFEPFNQQKEYFYIKRLPIIHDENDKKIDNIIKIKNYISYILYNCPKLIDFKFSGKDFSSTFSGLKNFLKHSENNIYFEYNINSLFDDCKKLEEKYIKNDYELLLYELKNEINKSTEILDFQIMSSYLEKIKICEKKIKLIKNIIELEKDVEINKKVQEIFFGNNNDKYKYELKYDENKKEYINNIEQFIKTFPSNKEKNIILIRNYLNFIFIILQNEEAMKKNNEELCKIKEKIYDNIFIKLYDKLYPQNPSKTDSLILINCEKLSWVEPKHFIQDNCDFNIFLNEIFYCFNQLEKERSPNNKLNNLMSIFEIISKIILFTGLESKESGNKIYIDLLKYIIICAKPRRLDSELEYIETFLFKPNNEILNKLKLLRKVCDILKNIKYNDLINISEEEFKLNCSKSL